MPRNARLGYRIGWRRWRWAVSFLSVIYLSFGSVEPLDTPALFERAKPTKSTNSHLLVRTGDGAGYGAMEYVLENGVPLLVLIWEGSKGPQGNDSPPYGTKSVETMWSTRLAVDDWCPPVTAPVV